MDLLNFIYKKFTDKNGGFTLEVALVLHDYKPSLLFNKKNLSPEILEEFIELCKENKINVIHTKSDEKKEIKFVISKFKTSYIREVMHSGDQKKLGEMLGYTEPSTFEERTKMPYSIFIAVEMKDTYRYKAQIYGQLVTDINKAVKQLEVVEYAINNEIKLPKGIKIEETFIQIDVRRRD
jgi:hypothetical protein